jgi:tRNA A37 threonylcarbamoyladenosine dehydratase
MQHNHNDDSSSTDITDSVHPQPSSTHAEADQAADFDLARRFGGVARLYGSAALERFRAAHVCVIGVGGVGSWAVEALARSAIGRITMIDLDHVAESNVNRQLHAMSDTLGMAKVEALGRRIAQINPVCKVSQIEEFIAADNIEQLIGEAHFDYVIDAIDDARAKVALIAFCRHRRIPLITIGSAGGQTDPTRITVCDLSRTEQEPLLAKVRKRLRQNHGFPRGTKNKFGVDAVYSTEPLTMPGNDACALPDSMNGEEGDSADAGRGGFTGLNCGGFGSSVVVTASFGLTAAAHVLRKLAATSAERSPRSSRRVKPQGASDAEPEPDAGNHSPDNDDSRNI